MANILIVDDSASIQQLAAFTLESQQHEVDIADDGALGLASLSKKQYDLVITDMNMPNMNGIEMTRQARQVEGYQHIPILMLTTESETSKKMEGKQAGVTGWVVKPFSPDGLLKIVGKVLN